MLNTRDEILLTDAVSPDCHSGQKSVPFVTPRVAVVVAGEHGHQAGGGGDGLHERDVLLAVRTGLGKSVFRDVSVLDCALRTYTVVSTIRTPPLALLSQNVVIVDAGLAIGIHASLRLQSLTGIGGNMDKRQ